MRTRFILGTGAVHNREVAFREEAPKFGHFGVQPKETVERNGFLFWNPDARTRLVIIVVLERRDETEAVRAAAQKYNDQGAARISIATNDCEGRVHDFSSVGKRGRK